MTAQDLVLNIAVNLGRISRWAMEKKNMRVNQFLKETENYLNQLEHTPKGEQFQKTFDSFKKDFQFLKNNGNRDEVWAENVLTWGNILIHRAKLA